MIKTTGTNGGEETPAARMRAGLIFALVAAVGLGAVTTQAKFVYDAGGNAVTLMAWRFFCSTLLIGLVLVLQRRSVRVAPGNRTGVLSLGVIWSGSMICYLMAVESISVSLAVLILYSYPILVMLVSLFTGRLVGSVLVIGVFAAGFVGIALMLGGGEMTLHPAGLLFALLAAAGAAYTFLKGSSVAPSMDPLVLSFWVNFAGIFLIVPLLPGGFSMPVGFVGLVCLLGATVSYIIAIVSQFQSLSRLSAARAALFFNLEPVVSILLAVLVLGEMLSWPQWSGAILVIVALISFSVFSGKGPALDINRQGNR